MEQKKELKVYKFEATCLKKNEDGEISDERETCFHAYAFDGNPSPRVDYNRYWEFGDGCLSLISKDGKVVDSDVSNAVEWLFDNVRELRGVDVRKMVYGLEAPGRWAEVCLGDAVKTTLRVTRLQELPDIDPKATISDSDLSVAQQHRVKIDGVPLFPEGGTVDANNPKVPTMVLRPNLARELGKVWEEFIRVSTGAFVTVTVHTINTSEDAAHARLTIKASTRKELDDALRIVGVLHPQDVEPNLVEGEGGESTRFTATVMLTTDV
jgi:hypothetical protein